MTIELPEPRHDPAAIDAPTDGATDGEQPVPATEPVADDDPGSPDEFDLDTWIDGVERPEREVFLFNPLAPAQRLQLTGLEATLADAEDRLAKARAAEEREEERSVTDLGSAAVEEEVQAALAAVLAFRDGQRARALRVTVTQVTIDERILAERSAADAGVPADWRWLHWAAEATTLPNGAHPTTEQLKRLVGRDVSGQAQVVALRRAIEELSAVPTVPSSPGSSTGRAGRTSSAS